MREDYIENLERMFPKGFLVIVRVDDDPNHVKVVLSKASDNRNLCMIYALINEVIKSAREKDNENNA